MANDNNKINELVVEDDDPTAELELPTFSMSAQDLQESDARTFDALKDDDTESARGVTVSELQSDLKLRKKTISRLQYDIEQLRTKWLGLEAEISARESQTQLLNEQLASSEETIAEKNLRLQKRKRKIRALQARLQKQSEENRRLEEALEAVEEERRQTAIADPPDTATGSRNDALTQPELRQKLARIEHYADALRQQTQDLLATNAAQVRSIESLTAEVSRLNADNTEISAALRDSGDEVAALQSRIEAIRDEHIQEIRLLRFELGTAQDTAVQTEELNNQLASDLVVAHGFKDELERELSNAEERSARKIEKLQREIAKLARAAESYEQKLTTKSEAITVLLAELAKKSEQIESINEIEDVIHDIDERMTERSARKSQSDPRSGSDRVGRVLIGHVDGQVLRFPLFKDRLTIGRTQDNDIQLKAAYISRRHAVIETTGESTRIIDWGSKNGIHVNATRVSEHQLSHGDTITIGNARFRYEELKKRDS